MKKIILLLLFLLFLNTHANAARFNGVDGIFISTITANAFVGDGSALSNVVTRNYAPTVNLNRLSVDRVAFGTSNMESITTIQYDSESDINITGNKTTTLHLVRDGGGSVGAYGPQIIFTQNRGSNAGLASCAAIRSRKYAAAGTIGGGIEFLYGPNGSDLILGMQMNSGGDVSIKQDLNVEGTLSKAAGTFKIDHPTDPLNKYLYHSFVESPEMMNVYNGIATCNLLGEATVELPGYFESLNKDFRYQLTCIGGYSPIFILEQISGNAFKIGGGILGRIVSWEVTGVRKDPYANRHRIQPEVEKELENKGSYLHPDCFQ